MKQLKSLFIISVMISMIFVSCDEDDPQIKITSISFNSATVEVVEGTTVNLDDILTVEGEDADQADISFSSDDEEVVSVDGNTLSAVAIGEATVEATEANTGESATISVTVVANVVAVTGVTLNEESADLKVGETLQLEATVAPADATEQGVTWSVDFPADSKVLEDDPTDIATVSDAGLVTAVSAGDIVVTAKTKDGEFTASVDIAVTNIDVTGITISPDPVEVNINESVQLSATIAPENATVQTVTWSVAMVESEARTSIEAVTVDYYLEISEDGLLTAKERCDDCEFTATATATDSEISETVDVSINYVPVTSITLDPGEFYTLGVDDTQQMTATILPENASDKDITWTIETSSSNCRVAISAPTYATVDNEGLVTGENSSGCYEITVVATSADGPTGSTDFEVVQYVTGLTILNNSGGDAGSSIDMPDCSSYQLGLTVSPGNASDQSVTWKSDNTDVLTVDATGKLTLNYGMITVPTNTTVKVTVTADDGSGVSDTIDVVVTYNGC